MVPSAPLAVDLKSHGGRIFERIRRETVAARRCAPCDNSWVAIDRIVHNGYTRFLFQRVHACDGGTALRTDLVGRELAAVGFAARRELRQVDGHIDVITDDCPGVRLRALVEGLKMRQTTLPHEVAWHIVNRTAALCEVWRKVGIQPMDTFVGFDGSLHLFPSMPACYELEMPSFEADASFDPLLVDASRAQLGELLCGTPPRFWLTFDEEGIRKLRESLHDPRPEIRRLLERFLVIAEQSRRVDPVVERAIEEFLAAPSSTDATAELAALVRDCFPRTHERHRRISATLGGDLDRDGLAREVSILAG